MKRYQTQFAVLEMGEDGTLTPAGVNTSEAAAIEEAKADGLEAFLVVPVYLVIEETEVLRTTTTVKGHTGKKTTKTKQEEV
jgi:hypothetical protein